MLYQIWLTTGICILNHRFLHIVPPQYEWENSYVRRWCTALMQRLSSAREISATKNEQLFWSNLFVLWKEVLEVKVKKHCREKTRYIKVTVRNEPRLIVWDRRCSSESGIPSKKISLCVDSSLTSHHYFTKASQHCYSISWHMSAAGDFKFRKYAGLYFNTLILLKMRLFLPWPRTTSTGLKVVQKLVMHGLRVVHERGEYERVAEFNDRSFCHNYQFVFFQSR